MLAASLAAAWGIGALAALGLVFVLSRGWIERSAGVVAALLWSIAGAFLLAVIIHDWRAARRHPGRIF